MSNKAAAYTPSKHPGNYDRNQAKHEKALAKAQELEKTAKEIDGEFGPLVEKLEEWLKEARESLACIKKDLPNFKKRIVDINASNEVYAEAVARIMVLESEMDRLKESDDPKDRKKFEQKKAEHKQKDAAASGEIKKLNAIGSELDGLYEKLAEAIELEKPRL